MTGIRESRQAGRLLQGYPALAGRQAEALWISAANPHPIAEAHQQVFEWRHGGLRATTSHESDAD